MKIILSEKKVNFLGCDLGTKVKIFRISLNTGFKLGQILELRENSCHIKIQEDTEENRKIQMETGRYRRKQDDTGGYRMIHYDTMEDTGG